MTAKKTLVYKGTEYNYRYAYKKNGVTMFVCDTTDLFGKHGDEVPAADVDSVSFADGTAVEK